MSRALPLGIACLLSAAPRATPQAKEPPVFRARVETVYVDAFVSRGGRSVPDLQASDFELKDNGVRQRVELVAADSLPLLATLAFDTSGSVAGAKLEALRAAGDAFLDALRPRDEVALLAFSDEIRWLTPATRERPRVRAALQQLRAAGATSALDALYAAVTLPLAQARGLVVLFSDGEDNLSWLDWKQVRLMAERSNTLVHVVGLRPPGQSPSEGSGQDVPPRAGELELEHIWALRQIAEATGGRYWEAEAPERLMDAFAAIARAMGERYVLRYEPEGVKRPGWHEIELRLRGRKGDVHARRGYWVGGR
jgi:VWFA-related protein